MKILSRISLLIGISMSIAQGQTVSPTNQLGVAQGPYRIIERGPHHRVIQRLTIETNVVNNRTIIRTNSHSYTEIETGMHRRNSTGEFVEASDGIAPAPGGAATTNSAHDVFFAANANSATALKIKMPDGKTILKSHVAWLRYSDKENGNSTIIAELTDSVGQIIGANEVLYTNALVGDCTADILYHNTKAGIEQDIILRSQPPDPIKYGISNAVLQVWTEFVGGPSPKRFASLTHASSEDERLDFGAMIMGPGEAFAIGGKASIRVQKHWVELEGRRFLVEQVPADTVRTQLHEVLRPLTGSDARTGGEIIISERHSPKTPFPKAATNTMQIAQSGANQRPGFLLDYSLVSTATNFTFKGDSTYYVSGAGAMLSGNVVFEGGTVLKYDRDGAIVVYPVANNATLTCRASAYRPIIFTAKDDQSVGETISGSASTPSGYYASTALALNLDDGLGPPVVSALPHIRISYAFRGLDLHNAVDISDAQFINCAYPLNTGNGTIQLRNALLAGSQTEVSFNGNGSLVADNVTFSGAAALAWTPEETTSELDLTNCVLADITTIVATVTNFSPGTITLNGGTNGFWSSPPFGYAVTNAFYPFQTGGGGHYYLANGCSFIGAGATNIDPNLLSGLRQKTTRPPIVQAGGLLTTTNLTLSPQVQREINSIDLGYAYDPIDYEFGAVSVTNGVTVTVAPGTVIAGFGTNGNGRSLTIANGAQFLAQGTPTQPVRVVEYSAVQEQTPINWNMPFYSLITDDIYENGSPPPAYFNCRFTDFASVAMDTPLLGMLTSSSDVRDCQFHGGYYVAYAQCTITNCLFERVQNFIQPYFSSGRATVCNSLFYGGMFLFASAYNTNGIIVNNLFDRASVDNDFIYSGGHNASVTNSGRVNPSTPTDIILDDTDYVLGPLGRFYYPTNGGNLSRLIDAGSTNAYYVGLYHFTVMTNMIGNQEIKETNSVVDIGFHYVAVDNNGKPTDRNSDGIADYLDPDTDGDGLTDAEELQIWLDTDHPELGHLDPSSPDTGNTGIPDGDKDSDHDGLSNIAELRTYHSDPCNAYTHCCLLDAYYYHTAVAELVGFPPPENQRAKARLFQTILAGQRLGFTVSGASPFAQYDLYFSNDAAALSDLTKRWKFRRVYTGILCDNAGQATFQLAQPDPNQGFFVVLSAEDSDLDFLSDGYEAWFRYNETGTWRPTDVNVPDSDFDGMNDNWEVEYGIDPTDDGSINVINGANGDPDSDNLNNFTEWQNYNALDGSYDPLKNFNTAPSRPVVSIFANSSTPTCETTTFTISRFGGDTSQPLTVYYAPGGTLSYDQGQYTLNPIPAEWPRIYSVQIPANLQSVPVTVNAPGVSPNNGDVQKLVISLTPYAVSPSPQEPTPGNWKYVTDWANNRAAITFDNQFLRPFAFDQGVQTCRNVPIQITLQGSAACNQNLTFTIVTQPLHGSLSPVTPQPPSSALVTYTPNSGFCGQDSFTFTASDGVRVSPTATVTIDVGDPNPVANCQDVMTGISTPAAFTISGSDLCNENLIFAVVPGTGPNHTAAFSITPIDSTHASVTYTPTSGYEGPDGFQFTVNDCRANSPSASVTINVVSGPALLATCGENKILLSWRVPDSIRSLVNTFKIYRCSTTSGSCTPVALYATVNDSNARTFTDNDVQLGTTYCYRVTFTHVDNCDTSITYESPFSNAACLQPCSSPPVLITGNTAVQSQIETYDFITGNRINSFLPTAATGVASGRALAIQGTEIFYTEAPPTDGIHVCPYGTQGSGGPDSRGPLSNPQTGAGIAGLSFHNSTLYVLSGYQTSFPLKVFRVDPATGNTIGAPISIASPASKDSDGFVVLPSGNFLINEHDESPIYHEYNGTTGAPVSGGLLVDLRTFGFQRGTGVALAPDGQSLYFVADVEVFSPHQTFVQTDLVGNLLSLQQTMSDEIEGIAVVNP